MDKEELIKMYEKQIEHKRHMQDIYMEQGVEENMSILDRYQEEIDELEKRIKNLRGM